MWWEFTLWWMMSLRFHGGFLHRQWISRTIGLLFGGVGDRDRFERKSKRDKRNNETISKGKTIKTACSTAVDLYKIIQRVVMSRDGSSINYLGKRGSIKCICKKVERTCG
jgi:hypothetical protein